MIAINSQLLKVSIFTIFAAQLIHCSPKTQGIQVEMAGQGGATFTPGQENGLVAGEKCQLTASPTQVAPGGSVLITAQALSQDITSLTVDNKSVPLPLGSVGVNPQSTTEYFAVGRLKSGDQVTCKVIVTVVGDTTSPPGSTPGPPPATTPATMNCTLTADPAVVSAGASSSLKIVAPNDATSIIVDGSALQNNGSKFVAPPSTQTYTANVSGPSGSGSCSVTVTVNSSSNSGGNFGLPNLRTTTKSCTAGANHLGLGTCVVSCPAGWILKDSSATPTAHARKHGGRCEASGGNYVQQGKTCYGSNDSYFTGYKEVCTCRILCEGY